LKGSFLEEREGKIKKKGKKCFSAAFFLALKVWPRFSKKNKVFSFSYNGQKNARDVFNLSIKKKKKKKNIILFEVFGKISKKKPRLRPKKKKLESFFF